MFAFLQNLLPRLRQFSQSLDQTELFVDKPWVLIDEDGRQQTYIFRRSGELLMSLDGHVQMGKWDYIAPAQSLLIDRGVDKLLLNHFFFTDALLVLARDGKADSKFVLANRQLIPDLNVEKYLLAFERNPKTISEQKKGLATNRITVRSRHKMINGTVMIFESSGSRVNVGDFAIVNEKPALNGRYVTDSGYGLQVFDGVITSIYWARTFKFNSGPVDSLPLSIC